MDITLSPLISDGMVLQRDMPVSLWGDASGPFTITFQEKQYTVLPDTAQHWELTLCHLAFGGPFPLVIGSHVFKNIYVGDVWLCAGQSNMQLPISRVKHNYPEILADCNPFIRQFSVPVQYDFHAPHKAVSNGQWLGAFPDTLSDFSAVGYFFAKALYEKHKIPIGLLQTAVGGTPIHCWMSKDSLASFPELIKQGEMFGKESYAAFIEAKNLLNTKRFQDSIDASDVGITRRFHTLDYDDSTWEERPLLTPLHGAASHWFRKTIDLPQSLWGQPATLFLGIFTDSDRVYANGTLVGETSYRYPPREYALPALPSGPLTLAIHGITKEGGGFVQGKQYLLHTPLGCINLNTPWRYHQGGCAKTPEPDIWVQNQPFGLYNAMIAPLHRYAIKGAIWYQGESDTQTPAHYADKFDAMITGWRNAWGYDFPVILTELAHWQNGANWEALRTEQWKCLHTPHTAMAACFDLGEHNDLHPLHKQTLGKRLARCALRIAYGETLPASPFEIAALSTSLE